MPKETKSERFTIHFTPSDKQTITSKARQYGMSMSSYLTTCALDKDITVIGDKDSFDELVRQVKIIGNNINQLRMLAQFGKISVIGLEDFTDELSEINSQLAKIIKRSGKWQR